MDIEWIKNQISEAIDKAKEKQMTNGLIYVDNELKEMLKKFTKAKRANEVDDMLTYGIACKILSLMEGGTIE